MLGLDELSAKLTGAVQSSGTGSDALAGNIYVALHSWLSTTVFSVFNTVLIFVVILFVFYGAFLYVTAYGDAARAEKAKKTLIFAFVGLIISLTAFGLASYTQRIVMLKSVEDQLQAPGSTTP